MGQRPLRPLTHPFCPPKKVFIVPVGNHSNIPFSRVNHSKFMVTEKAAYIGERAVAPSSWAPGAATPARTGLVSFRQGPRC